MRTAAKEKARAAWFQVGDAARLQLHHTPWWRHLRRDFRRYRATGEPPLRAILLSQGLWASAVYRVCRAALLGHTPRWLRGLSAPFAAGAQKLAEILTGISIPPGCEIGEGLYIGHFGPVILDARARVGHNCSLAQSVTLGACTVGNRVFIGAHSLIADGVVVGDDAVVCTGSVVTKPVPARAVVLGNPARVVSYEGSFEYVVYDGMDDDDARKASLSSTVLA
jgi:serine O-acetyltransferase